MKYQGDELIPDLTLRDAYLEVANTVKMWREKFVASTANIEQVKLKCGPSYAHVPNDWIRARIPACCKCPDRHGGGWGKSEKSKPGKNRFNELESMGNERYLQYLKSSQWESVREKRKRMDGMRCRLCDSQSLLQVHHRTYKTVGAAEEVNDCTTLCEKCHKKYHHGDNGMDLFGDWQPKPPNVI